MNLCLFSKVRWDPWACSYGLGVSLYVLSPFPLPPSGWALSCPPSWPYPPTFSSMIRARGTERVRFRHIADSKLLCRARGNWGPAQTLQMSLCLKEYKTKQLLKTPKYTSQERNHRKKNAFFSCFLNMLVPSCFSHVWFFVTLCTVAHQASLSMGILWARILEWVAISYSRGSSQSKDWTHVSCIGRRILYHCATWEDLCINISLSHFAIHLKLTWYYKSAILQYKNVLGQEK